MILHSNGKECIWVVGSPRSGNNWLVRLVAEALDSPATGMPNQKAPTSQEGLDRPGDYRVIHEHIPYRTRGMENKVIYVYRDPRDVMTSAMHYWQTGSIMGAINKEIDRWNRFMRYWYFGDNATCYVSYEQLIEDTEGQLARVLDECELEPLFPLNAVVAHQEFKAKKRYIERNGDKLPYGKVGQLKILRKGIVGDWRNHFTREDARAIHMLTYEYMNKLGYEDDPDWWTKVPERL